MAHDFKLVMQEIGRVLADVFGFGEKKSYVREMLIAVFVLISIGSVYLGYRWYIYNREQNAQKIFADYFHDYQMAISADSPSELERVESLLSQGFLQNKKSYLAPYFLALLADTQIKQGKIDPAISTLSRVIETTDNESMKQLFQIKRALMQLDSSDETLRQEGLHGLIEASRKKNDFTDMALFYLGLYYWSQNATDEARGVWQELVDLQYMNKMQASPWVYEAQSKLKQLQKG